MSSQNPLRPRQPCRRDGWTPARQFAFLTTLARTRCVSTAAKAATMSRESAYRLRRREPHGLFALSWDRAIGPVRAPLPKGETDKGHTRVIVAVLPTEGRGLAASVQDCHLRDPGQAAGRSEKGLPGHRGASSKVSKMTRLKRRFSFVRHSI